MLNAADSQQTTHVLTEKAVLRRTLELPFARDILQKYDTKAKKLLPSFAERSSTLNSLFIFRKWL